MKQRVQSLSEEPEGSVRPRKEGKAAVSFPVVGIGASAGGLAAIEAFFTAMPTDTKSGMAFVVVQHLDPGHKSMLLNLVKCYTEMQVYKVEDGTKVQPDCVYIIPPNRDMAFLNGKLHLMERSSPRGLWLPIDFFFRSLAQGLHERAICVVLSGSGSDGTLGLKAIKGEGGMAMVQAPESATHDGMPRSAIATGLVDYVLPPDKMSELLIAYGQHLCDRRPWPFVDKARGAGESLEKLFVLLRHQTGHDFSHYKHNIIHRRVETRMAVNQIDHVERYVRYLERNPREVETLFRELLIGVTNFFRDPEAFEVLKEEVIPRLLTRKLPSRPVRVWVPACSTGEEAYSLAILLQESVDNLKQNLPIQIFASDIDAEAIDRARAGVYPESIAADVSVERLGRFFTQDKGTYRIRETVRDLVVFARQDILKDPPFSKIDLISCRNLLIYMGAELQKKLVPLFHYSLNEEGHLLLGNSESTGEFLELFSVVNRKWKLYRRKGVVASRSTIAPFGLSRGAEGTAARSASQPGEHEGRTVRDLVEKALLEDAPACVLINANYEVLYIHGRTGKYLQPAVGGGSLNLLGMARDGLKLELAAAVHKVIAQQVTVRCQALPVKANGEVALVNLVVRPVATSDRLPHLMLVVFEDVIPETRPDLLLALKPPEDQGQRITELERELRTKEECLQTALEELETANEELESTNEELQSSNEELHCTNEHLETSNEDLRSTNEELITDNAELQKKILGLSQANNDMNNMLAGTGVGTVFVDHTLHIRRFTPSVTQIVKLLRAEVGSPLSDLSPGLSGHVHLEDDVRTVLQSLVPREAEVQTVEGRWYWLRIQPYRSLENVIGGAALTFVDISKQKQLQRQLQERLA